MDSTELNTLLAELSVTLMKRFALSVEAALGIVMQSQLAADLKSGKCNERDIDKLIATLTTFR